MQECPSASVLSEFLLPLDLLSFLPYLLIPFCAATSLQQFSPACSTIFFLDLLPILITSSQSWSLCRRSRASCFCSLQNPSVLSELLVSSGTTIRILKLRRSLDAYIANRLAIKGFRRRTFLLCLPSDPATRSKPPCIRIEEAPSFQLDSQFSPAVVYSTCTKRPFHCSGLVGIFNDAQLDDANMLSRSATGHSRSSSP